MNPGRTSRRKSSIRGAFTLIEVTVALGVATFCLVTVFTLVPIGLTSNQAAFEQTTAGNISDAILADLRCAQPMGASESPRFGIPIPAPPATAGGGTESSGTTIYFSANGTPSPTGEVVTSGANLSRYRATIGFSFPASGQYSSPTSSRTATAVRVLITWPALADPNPGVWTLGSSASWPTLYTGSFEADTMLDRN